MCISSRWRDRSEYTRRCRPPIFRSTNLPHFFTFSLSILYFSVFFCRYIAVSLCTTILSLDIKRCMCHFAKWQIHPFISKITICHPREIVNRLPCSHHPVRLCSVVWWPLASWLSMPGPCRPPSAGPSVRARRSDEATGSHLQPVCWPQPPGAGRRGAGLGGAGPGSRPRVARHRARAVAPWRNRPAWPHPLAPNI